jgi:hypothetical protein
VAFSAGGQERVLVNLPDVVHAILADGDEELRATRVTDAARKVLDDGLILSRAPQLAPAAAGDPAGAVARDVRRHAELFTRDTLARIRR